jgi:hypothetical protein
MLQLGPAADVTRCVAQLSAPDEMSALIQRQVTCIMIVTSRLLMKGSECFECLMLRQAQQNGKSSIILKPRRSF